MKKPISTEEALVRLQQLCSRSEKSEYDIRKKLKQWNFSGDPLYIIEELKKDNFLNEERYINAFVNDKIKYSKWGKKKVEYHLSMTGCGRGLIKEALSNFPNSEYLKIIETEIAKKSKSLKEDDPYKRGQKLLAFGYQRGFEVELLRQVVEKLES